MFNNTLFLCKSYYFEIFLNCLKFFKIQETIPSKLQNTLVYILPLNVLMVLIIDFLEPFSVNEYQQIRLNILLPFVLCNKFNPLFLRKNLQLYIP